MTTRSVAQPVVERLTGVTALDFPRLLARAPEVFSHLFASLAPGVSSGASTEQHGSAAENSRWSILMSAARAELRLSAGGTLQFIADSIPDFTSDLVHEQGFLAAFSRWVGQHAEVVVPEGIEVPFVGGWSFYLSYELAEEIEPSVHLPAFAPSRAKDFPVAVAQYHPAALIFDQINQVLYLAHDGRDAASVVSIRAALTDYRTEKDAAPEPDGSLDTSLAIEALTPDDPAAYVRGVERILEYLQAGDVFQANLSRAWRFLAPQADAGGRIFQRLGQYNPAPFSAWYRLAEGQIISSSPERLVDHVAGRVSTRPIAGTRRRDRDTDRDQALMAELRAHPKERAEHVMLIDLERNDLGRVCQPGSVVVDELMVIESFAHVHHLVSNVTGRLRADRSVFDALAATFPGGTITGCPKVRCMAILAELEGTGRGPYTGSVGYLSLHGRMDSNILIRTVFLSADGVGEFRAGAGIVADSQPERECVETEEKARGLLLALGATPV